MSENETNDDEPEIIVDTDWKDQVARERDAAADESSDTKPTDSEAPAAASEVKATGDDNDAPSSAMGDPSAPPPASFTVLISMLFSQAMAMLGQMPDPESGETTVNKLFAKHYIDTLEMLEGKTKGNLTDEESSMLGEALHALRMMYVNAKAT